MNKQWNTVNIEYPVRQFPDTGTTSEEIGHRWRCQPEVLKSLKREPEPEEIEYSRNFNVNKDLNRSQTNLDFSYKTPSSHRINKHTSSVSNEYLYPSTRQYERRPLKSASFATTENQDKFAYPKNASRLVTEKNQFKHPRTLPDYDDTETFWSKDYPELDTTYEGFEKYLDPYLTTNRLHHRPYTTEQLNKSSVSKDVVTYYTFADVPWIHTPKPNCGNWWLRQARPANTTYDREKFKQHFREIIVHNQPNWIPGTFRTETRDNYTLSPSSIGKRSLDIEDNIKGYYKKSIANLQSKTKEEHQHLFNNYSTESHNVGTGQAVCTILKQFSDINERLLKKQNK